MSPAFGEAAEYLRYSTFVKNGFRAGEPPFPKANVLRTGGIPASVHLRFIVPNMTFGEKPTNVTIGRMYYA